MIPTPALRLALGILILACLHSAQSGTPTQNVDPIVARWLGAQTNIQTWSARFTQTRSLKTLSAPLVSQGHLWFAAPGSFRWELGNPPATIAIRQPAQMLVLYPRLKRAERYPINATRKNSQWTDLLALLEAGFPRTESELLSRFSVSPPSYQSNQVDLALEPRSPAAKKLMPRIKISFETNTFTLRSTELNFADGSRLRNDFSESQINPKLDPALFQPELGDDYKMIEPLKQ